MTERPKFYTDAHIDKKAVKQLQRKGVDIVHCADVGLNNAKDIEHLTYTTAHGRIMISCDVDFEHLHVEWQQENREHAGIVYFVMPGQCKNIGLIVSEIYFLYEAANYETDLYNQFWRVTS